jgi:hypothetical protein
VTSTRAATLRERRFLSASYFHTCLNESGVVRPRQEIRRHLVGVACAAPVF